MYDEKQSKRESFGNQGSHLMALMKEPDNSGMFNF